MPLYSDPGTIAAFDALFKDLDSPCMVILFLVIPLLCVGTALLFGHKKWFDWFVIVMLLSTAGAVTYHILAHTNTVAQMEQK